jgi:hypothetical protein
MRALLLFEPDLKEKALFGGLAFPVNGRMAVAISGHGGAARRHPFNRGRRPLSSPLLQTSAGSYGPVLAAGAQIAVVVSVPAAPSP